MAMVNGTPGFVTALGETGTASGWRGNKWDGGLLMDVPQNKILFQGLSMPHSPRWRRNVVWMLESDCCKRSFSMKHINTVKAMVSFLVLSVFCFVFSPVWAATYTVTSNEDSGEGTLRQAIIDANATTEVDDDIVFNLGSGNETITLSSELSIYDNLTIDGDNTGSGTDITIDGDNSCRVFYIHPGWTVTLDNLTIQNGNSDWGGGIWNTNSNLTIKDCTITGNRTSHGGGGGIYITGGIVTLKDCTITGNIASSCSGGGIYNSDGIVTLEGTNTFTGNFSSAFPNPGEGIYIESGTLSLAEDSFLYMDESFPLYYDGGDFSGNNCTVIFNAGAQQIINYDITFDNLELSTGTVLKDQDGGIVTVSGETSGAGTVLFDFGGAFTYNGTCDQTVFSGNYITLNLSGTDSTKTFADGTTKIGQEISVTDSMTFSGSSSDNVTVQVTVPGTSAWRVFNINASDETVNISNMTIKGGSIPTINNFGGGIYVSSSILNLDAVILSGSTAYSGGGIYAASSTITITKSAINGNTATFGGGLYCTASIVTMADATIDGNETSGGSNFGGGGIYCTNSSTLMLTRCAVSNNSTALNGGGIYATNTTSTVTLANSTVFHNLSDLSGGGIYNKAALSIENCTIAENHSGNDGTTIRGGGIYQVSGTLDVKNTIIANNYRGSGTGTGDDYYYVGGILTDNQYNVVENQDGTSNQFGPTNNLLETDPTGLATSLSYLGGFTEVVEVTSGNLTTANPGSTSETTDQRGYYRKSGTVYYGDTPTETTTNTITRGAYQYYGVVARSNAVDDWTSGSNDYYTNIKGAAERESSGAIKLAGTAIYEPGIALDDNETITIQGAGVGTTYVQADATAGTASNRVFNITNGTITLEDMTIRNGNVSDDGGGIYNEADLIITDCTISENTATGGSYGCGGICNSGTLTLTNSTVSSNTASVSGGIGAYGGGICGTGSGATTLTNCSISGNVANDESSGIGAYGGGISIFGDGGVTLQNCTISGNTVASSFEMCGAGFHLKTGTAHVKNTIIAQNSDNAADYDYVHESGTLIDDGYNVVEYQCLWYGWSTDSGFDSTTSILFNYDDQGNARSAWNSNDNTPVSGSLNLSTTLALNGSFNGTYTLALGEGSFAAGSESGNGIPPAGSWNGSPADDQRGVARFANQNTSIGAYSENYILPNVTWTGSDDSDWTNGNNWSGGSQPGGEDDVIIPDAGTTDNDPDVAGQYSIQSLTVQDGGVVNFVAETSRITADDGDISITGTGEGGNGAVIATGGNQISLLASTGDITFGGAKVVSATGAVTITGANSVQVTGTTTMTSTSGTVTINSDNAALAGGGTLSIGGGAGTVDIQDATSGLAALTISAAAQVDLQNVSVTTGNIDVTGTNIDLNGTTYTSDVSSVTFTGAVDLDSGIGAAITSGGGSGDNITLTGTINGKDDNTQSLTLDAGISGTVSVSGAIGGADSKQIKTLTLTNSGGATFSGAVTADTSIVLTETSAGQDITFEGDVVTGTFTTTATHAYDVVLQEDITVTDDCTFGAVGNLTIGTAEDDIATFSGGLDTRSATGTVALAGTVATSNTAMDFGALTAAADTTLNPAGGTITFGAVTLNDGVTLTVGTGDTGAVTFGGTIDSAGGGTGNLTLNTDDTATLQANAGGTTAIGNLTITSGTLGAGAHGINLSGNWTNSDTFTAGTGTVTFNGSADSTLQSGGSSFYGLVLNKSTGTMDTKLSPSDDLTVSNALAVTKGTFDLDTSDKNLSLGGALDIEANGRWKKSSDATRTVTFYGADCTFTDNNNSGSLQNLGHVKVDD